MSKIVVKSPVPKGLAASTAGYDYFSPEPGKHKSMNCLVCDAKMKVKRSVNGPTGMAESMAGKKHLHDTFYCSHSGELWHNQVIALKKLVISTPSANMAVTLENEIKWILKNKKHTKEDFDGKYIF